MKKTITGTIALLGVFILVLIIGMIGYTAEKTEEYYIRVANFYPKDSLVGTSLDEFARLVNEKSNGRVKVEVFHDGVLGRPQEVTEDVAMGSLEMCLGDNTGIGTMVKENQVLELPYIYRDLDHAFKVHTEVFPILRDMILKKGFRSVALYTEPPRVILSKVPVRSLEDIIGLKLRVPEVTLYIELFKALKANITIVSWSEIYTALQTGVVDACENNIPNLYHSKLHEQAKYMTHTNHIITSMHLIISEQYFQSLPKDIQDIIVEAGQKSVDLSRTNVKKMNKDVIAAMEAEGAKSIYLSQEELKKFQEATDGVRKQLAEKISPDVVPFYEQLMDIATRN